MAAFFLPSGEVDLDQFGNKKPQTIAQIEQQLRRTCLIRNERTCFAFPTSECDWYSRART
jgi:hypothetical protein